MQYKEVFRTQIIRDSPALVLTWQQFTKNRDTEIPLHSESGYLKILPIKAQGAIGDQYCAELMISHPFSVNEMYKECIFDFDSNTLTAKAMTPDCF